MTTTELQVLNAVLQNKDVGVLFGASVDDLFEAYGDVWDSIKKYHGKYHTIPDIEVLQERFDDLEKVSVPAATEHYVDKLKAEFMRNRMENIFIKAGTKLTDDNSPFILSKVQEELSRLGRFSNASRALNVMDLDDAERHYAEIRERAAAMGGTPGIPTGVSFIDSAYTSGLAGGDLVVVLGWTGRAKSLFTTLVCCNAHSMGHRPMIVSLEMSGQKLRDRILTIQGSGAFRNSDLTLGQVDANDFERFKKEMDGKTDFYVVTNDGVNEMTPNVVQAHIDQYQPTVLVFDYAQLATDNENSNDMVSRMRNMSKQYKRLAVANDIPIILISSATADSSASANEPPTIEQVAWSRQLAFDADLAFAVHKHDDSNIIEIVCRKNRNGPQFSGYLDWDIDRGIWKEAF